MTRALRTDLLTPEAVVAHFAEAGIDISERELRKRAREIGAYRQIGKAMFLTSDDVYALTEMAQFGISEEQKRRWLDPESDEDVAAESAAQDGLPPTGVVYFIERKGEVKIGFTTDIKKRLHQFRTATTDPFDVLLTIPATPALERYFHQKFAEYQIEREWFRHAGELEAFVVRRRWSGRK